MLIGETIILRSREVVVDLIIMDMLDFDITLGMNFLSRYGAKIYYKKKKS